MDNFLELLTLAKDYDVKKLDDGGFEIRSRYYNLGATESPKNGIQYFITEYDSQVDWIEIDPYCIDELRHFCELFIELYCEVTDDVSNGN